MNEFLFRCGLAAKNTLGFELWNAADKRGVGKFEEILCKSIDIAPYTLLGAGLLLLNDPLSETVAILGATVFKAWVTSWALD